MLAIGSACFALFLDKCFQKGMILRWYYVWLMVNFYYSSKTWKYYISKPLGTCIYCFASWVFIALYLGLIFANSENTALIKIFVEIALGLGINYVIIRIYEKFIGDN